MDWSATRKRSLPTVDPGVGQELSSEVRAAIPPRFEAVGESLASGSGSVAACEVLGGVLARDGVSLAEALDDLATTWRLVRDAEPAHAELRALAVAWSDATLGYVHGLSCHDPLTGLSTLAHLRACIGDAHRAGPVADAGVLVVVEVAPCGELLAQAMADAQLGEIVRGVFPGRETIGRIAPGRLVVLADRDDRLVRRVDLLQRMVVGGAAPRPRVWIEGLPDSDVAAVALLDELARL
ncbi:hypothetical protein [Nocardioides sp. URHA0020]|uniref:hypothetical protein n=1 Tax=Nocardioides sp. URHA0020 TaxID=1380392 RepID=UPI001E5BB12F|nr:hypothetical protein [Nocardioides sp. URHA0020]